MANTNRANGFRPAKSLFGDFKGLIRMLPAGSRTADTTNNHGDIYIGDPVKIVTGTVFPANSNDTIAGVCVGIGTSVTMGDPGQNMFKASALEQRYLAYNESGYVWYVPAEGVLFEAQTAADLDLVVGATADFSTDAGEAHGSRTSSQSSAQIVSAVNNDVVVVEDVTSPDNDTTLQYARHLVMFKKTQNTL